MLNSIFISPLSFFFIFDFYVFPLRFFYCYYTILSLWHPLSVKHAFIHTLNLWSVVNPPKNQRRLLRHWQLSRSFLVGNSSFDLIRELFGEFSLSFSFYGRQFCRSLSLSTTRWIFTLCCGHFICKRREGSAEWLGIYLYLLI